VTVQQVGRVPCVGVASSFKVRLTHVTLLIPLFTKHNLLPSTTAITAAAAGRQDVNDRQDHMGKYLDLEHWHPHPFL
jgi:hypothetical protein